jgi:hypothetical protein
VHEVADVELELRAQEEVPEVDVVDEKFFSAYLYSLHTRVAGGTCMKTTLARLGQRNVAFFDRFTAFFSNCPRI